MAPALLSHSSSLLAAGRRPEVTLSSWRGPARTGSLMRRHAGRQHIARAVASIPGASAQPAQKAGGTLGVELRAMIDQFVTGNKVVLFMKGNRQFPQCGFSNTCVQILNNLKVPYETVNILENELLRSGLKEYSQWPTFPQLYIDGEFFGGCDITIEAYQSGELVEALEKAMAA